MLCTVKSASLALVSVFLFSVSANAENVLILKEAFIQKYKNRATIEANYIIDKAHKKPNASSKDADIHVAGRSPGAIGCEPARRRWIR